jgi:hypothetical protein
LRSVTIDCCPRTRSRHSAASISACSSAASDCSLAARPASRRSRAVSCSPDARIDLLGQLLELGLDLAEAARGVGELILGAAEILLGRDEGELALVGLVARALEGGRDLGHAQAQRLLGFEQRGELRPEPGRIGRINQDFCLLGASHASGAAANRVLPNCVETRFPP